MIQSIEVDVEENIKKLRIKIEELSAEISSIKVKDSEVTAEEYTKRKIQRDFLRNLLSLATNELHSLLHLYSATLFGTLVVRKNERTQEKLIIKFYSETSCTDSPPKTLTAGSVRQDVLNVIDKEYSKLFVDEKYEVTRVKQLR